MKIISGGQTGADRAGLDAAITLSLDYGGALPKGRLTEAGPLDARYRGMSELPTSSYPARTAKNVKDADGTVIFTFGRPDRGSALTETIARRYRKPLLVVDLNSSADSDAALALRAWIAACNPTVINIAGSRESRAPGIYRRVFTVLIRALSSEREAGQRAVRKGVPRLFPGPE